MHGHFVPFDDIDHSTKELALIISWNTSVHVYFYLTIIHMLES